MEDNEFHPDFGKAPQLSDEQVDQALTRLSSRTSRYERQRQALMGGGAVALVLMIAAAAFILSRNTNSESSVSGPVTTTSIQTTTTIGATSTTIASLPQPLAVGMEDGTVWGVYWVFKTYENDPDEARVKSELKAKSIDPHPLGDINCDHGAQEALGVPSNSPAMAYYFHNESDARGFATNIGIATSPNGVVKVEIACND